MEHAPPPPAASPLDRALPLVAVIALWAVIEVAFVWSGITPILRGDFPDGDGYARLLRVMHLVETGNWYDGTLPRSNWPFGETMNWTRPLDLLLLAGSTLFRPFMNLHDALFWFGSIMSPFCALAAAFAAAWIAKPILGPRPRYAIMALLLLQTGVLSYTDAGRVDHHGILILSFVLACGFTLRALKWPDRVHSALAAGVMIGVGLWISTEFMPLLACVLATGGLLWLFGGARWVGLNRRFALGFLLTVAAVLPIERSPAGGLLVEEHDRISIVHLLLAVLLVTFWWLVPLAAQRLRDAILPRTATAGFAAVAAGAIMLALYPRFFGGPLAAIDPALIPIWFSRIAEWQPIVPNQLVGFGRLLFWLGSPLVAAPWAFRAAWVKRHDDAGPAWLFLALGLVGFIVLTLRGIRFSCYAEILALIPLFCTVTAARRALGERPGWSADVLRATSVTILVLGLPFAGAFILGLAAPGNTEGPLVTCRIADLAPVLNDPTGLGRRTHVIAADIDRGPEIMYRTQDAVLGTPMHRNAAGIMAIYRLLTAPDDKTAKAIIDSRGVDLVLLCPNSVERPFYGSAHHEDTFYNRLVEGPLPAWMRAVPLPDALAGNYRIYSVAPADL